MNPLYNAGIHLFKFGARIGSLRSPKIRKMIEGQKQTFEILKNHPEGFDLWIHAASLGEFEQGRPLIERLRRERPEMRILLTFFSPSGYEIRKNYDKVDCVAYLPFDTPELAARFLDAVNPKMAIFVKYEFWGNYLEQLSERHIPTYIISTILRPGQRFFRPWGGMFRNILRCFTHFYVQDDDSRRLLANVGIDNVTVAGDTRFDRVTDILRTGRDYPEIAKWKGTNHLLLAGSSWPEDESRYISYINNHSQIKAIIAPHEFDDHRLQLLKSHLKGKTMFYSEIKGEIPQDVQVLIIDSFGHLSSLYRYATVALIGGGHGVGIHNINEAAVYGVPVVFGPNHYKFREASDLIDCGGGFEYTDARSIASILDSLFSNSQHLDRSSKAAAEYIKSHLGATDIIYSQIFSPHK